MRKFKYQRLYDEIKNNKETIESVASLIGISKITFSRKLKGNPNWKMDEIDKLCSHFKKNYYELFKEEKAWKISEFKGEGICEIEDLKSG